MKINERLKRIGDLVDANSFCLDVGCDHAFLDIYLVKKNCGIRAIASDIGEGPVMIAKENIKKERLDDQIEVRLGNGLDTYSSGIDTVIISGMGGRNMIGIFKRNLAVLRKIQTILISPNNYQEEIKRFLCKNGFYIEQEQFVKDKKIIYQIIKLRRGRCRYNRREYFFGPVFLHHKTAMFYEYYQRELKSREILLTMLPKNYYWKRFVTRRSIRLLKSELIDKV